jgi:hypothetical protein
VYWGEAVLILVLFFLSHPSHPITNVYDSTRWFIYC